MLYSVQPNRAVDSRSLTLMNRFTVVTLAVVDRGEHFTLTRKVEHAYRRRVHSSVYQCSTDQSMTLRLEMQTSPSPEA